MSPRNKFVLVGGLVGGALGALAAWAYLQQQEGGLWTKKRIEGNQMLVEAGWGDLLRVGMAVFGIMRQVQAMAKRA